MRSAPRYTGIGTVVRPLRWQQRRHLRSINSLSELRSISRTLRDENPYAHVPQQWFVDHKEQSTARSSKAVRS